MGKTYRNEEGGMKPIEIDPYENSDRELDFICETFIPEFNLYIWSRCLFNFPQFEKDFEALWRNKIITEANKKFKWNYSLTSLGQYFLSLDAQWSDNIWEVVEPEFGLPRHTLKHLVNANGREPDFIRAKAIDYEKLMEILEPHRKQVEEQNKEAEKKYYETKYNSIKDFILNTKIPENETELENFADELTKKASCLTALF